MPNGTSDHYDIYRDYERCLLAVRANLKLQGLDPRALTLRERLGWPVHSPYMWEHQQLSEKSLA